MFGCIKVPSGHKPHTLEPGVSAYDPWAQGVHIALAFAPRPRLDVPTGHFTHVDRPTTSAYVPEAHNVQAEAMGAGL